jgi:hypothetical protein
MIRLANFSTIILTFPAIMTLFSGTESYGQNKTKAYTSDELEMMKDSDSVKVFRLETMTEAIAYPTALPDRVLEERTIEIVSEEFQRKEITESFHETGEGLIYKDEFSRLMTESEINGLLEFLSNSGRASTEVESGCMFAPGAGIKFYKGNERFYVLLCFNCSIWAFQRREAMYYVKFDNKSKKELVNYAKGLFPNDLEFQLLND